MKSSYTSVEPVLASTGDMVAIPGLAGPSIGTQASVDAFLRGQPQRDFLPAPGAQRPADAAFAGFEEAYQEGLQRPPTPFPHSIINGDRGELRPFLQVTAGKSWGGDSFGSDGYADCTFAAARASAKLDLSWCQAVRSLKCRLCCESIAGSGWVSPRSSIRLSSRDA